MNALELLGLMHIRVLPRHGDHSTAVDWDDVAQPKQRSLWGTGVLAGCVTLLVALAVAAAAGAAGNGSSAGSGFSAGRPTPSALRSLIATDEQAAQITLNDARLSEGNTGQTTFPFVLTLDHAHTTPITVDFATANGTATAPSDYTPTSGTLTFNPGETFKVINVQVNGDTTPEPTETFKLNLTNPSNNATLPDPQATGTIINDDSQPPPPPSRISIGDVRLAEGNSGQTAFRFAVSLDRAQGAPVTVHFATANGTAAPPSDFVAGSGTLTFAPGQTTRIVAVPVIGDLTVEPDETFAVNVTNATGNATIADTQGTGMILNDDSVVTPPPPSRISIANARRAEGNAGRTRFRFTVSIDRAERTPVTVAFSTANGTARAPGDYAAARGTLTFGPGETTKIVTVLVRGDRKREANETFAVNLSNPTGNAALVRAHAVGTIVNDDRRRARLRSSH